VRDITRRTAPAVLLAVLLAVLATVTACTGGAGMTPHPSGSGSATASGATSSDTASGSDTASSSDPASLAAPVTAYARRAGIRPQLLMAILQNESYKPHDPDFQRRWLQIDPGASLGVANMHRAAFDDAKRGRDFARHRWEDLIDDPALAVEAAAWYLHDLSAQLPRRWSGKLSRDELIALGYNAGPGNMLTFARGVPPGPQAQAYLDNLHHNWAAAAAAVAAVATRSP
jgi:soluble lytic murein transglycosylase-like protein